MVLPLRGEMRNGRAEVEASEEYEVNGPLVFQCGGCRSIVGDTFAWVSALQDLDAIVLSRVLAAIVRYQTSRQEADAHGSRFQRITCSQCARCLGRKYSQHASPEHQSIVGYYALDRAAIQSYELGAKEVGEDEGHESMMMYHGGGGVVQQGGVRVEEEHGEEWDELVKAVSENKDDVAKLKGMLLLMDDRIKALEEPKHGRGGGAQAAGGSPRGAAQAKRKRL